MDLCRHVHEKTNKNKTKQNKTKNSINITIRGIPLLSSLRDLKFLNNIEKIQARMMYATFNGDPITTTISYLRKGMTLVIPRYGLNSSTYVP